MKLLNSRRFLLLLLDTVVSVLLHFYGGPDTAFIIGALQPVFIALISAYTVDDTVQSRIDAAK